MSTDGHGTKCRRNIAENFNRLSRAHERYSRQTTDKRAGVSIERTFAKTLRHPQYCTVVRTWVQDRATATRNTYRKFREVWNVFLDICVWTDRHTSRHEDCNTSLVNMYGTCCIAKSRRQLYSFLAESVGQTLLMLQFWHYGISQGIGRKNRSCNSLYTSKMAVIVLLTQKSTSADSSLCDGEMQIFGSACAGPCWKFKME